MPVHRVEIGPPPDAPDRAADRHVLARLREAGLAGLQAVRAARLYLLEGDLDRNAARLVADNLLVDPVIESVGVLSDDDPAPRTPAGWVGVEVHPRPGVMDPVAQSTHAELRARGLAVDNVRTGWRYLLAGTLDSADVVQAVRRVLANDCIEEVVPGTAGVRPAPRPPVFAFALRHVPLRELNETELEALSRSAHLFLSPEEMRAIQVHFREQGREPTDLELETLAQTWSEHCVHKTLRSAILYRGAPLPGATATDTPQERQYDNLLKDTIARATEALIAAGRGPQCLSVFKDNAGVIAFDDDFGIAFKVETHNHPSAIEPYGGAATGIGGVIRDIIGCGLGAKPIANTDIFCVAQSDWPQDALPKGVLHPRRVLRGIVQGVADYGNRMGIPTVNGAVYFDPRYLGNPLVYCGCVGLMPRDMVEKAARPGDAIVVVGGRTGRDGIHGATFSSAELTDTHADEFSHAVQIGNAITEKRFLDAVLQARDAAGGCLYNAITDCGAGGLSSAVGEMGEAVGAVVDLETVPLKYAGLRYDEIWISEAQERMVLAVPPASLDAFMQIMAAEEVEATVIGTFGHEVDDKPRLVLRYDGNIVGDLDLHFLHHGVPRRERTAVWEPPEHGPDVLAASSTTSLSAADLLDRLRDALASPNAAAKEWIIRQYDHEVQGGSVVKPLLGRGRGPGDAAVLLPRLDNTRGLAVGCGLAGHLADVDPYWMAAASIDEALRNVIAVGGDPAQTAILDNFCWGRSDDPHQLGALVRACQACYDVALVNGVPFISGKDSLNNEFALDESDIAPLIAALRTRAAGDSPDAVRLRAILPSLERKLHERRRLAIPPTLLISAISIVPDAGRCVTSDLKRPGHQVVLLGGLPPVDYELAAAAGTHRVVASLVADGRACACHDVSDGGWLTALAEMALAGDRGVDVAPPAADANLPAPFADCCATYLLESDRPDDVLRAAERSGVNAVAIATVRDDTTFRVAGHAVEVQALQAAWRGDAAI